jgi:hypothetical protein
MILLTTFFLPCLFQFLEMVWDKKVGDVLQLFVVRPYQNDPIDVNMVVDEVAVEKFNR